MERGNVGQIVHHRVKPQQTINLIFKKNVGQAVKRALEMSDDGPNGVDRLTSTVRKCPFSLHLYIISLSIFGPREKNRTLLYSQNKDCFYITSTFLPIQSSFSLASTNRSNSLAFWTVTFTFRKTSSAVSGTPPNFCSTHISRCALRAMDNSPVLSRCSKCVGSSIGGVDVSGKNANVKQKGVWWMANGTGARSDGACYEISSARLDSEKKGSISLLSSLHHLSLQPLVSWNVWKLPFQLNTHNRAYCHRPLNNGLSTVDARPDFFPNISRRIDWMRIVEQNSLVVQPINITILCPPRRFFSTLYPTFSLLSPLHQKAWISVSMKPWRVLAYPTYPPTSFVFAWCHRWDLRVNGNHSFKRSFWRWFHHFCGDFSNHTE